MRGMAEIFSETVWGLVLAGGKSGRMGTDKALLATGEGETFLERAHRLLSQVARPCLVSMSPSRSYPGYRAVFDMLPQFGPVAGIQAALAAARAEGAAAILALACDLPLMNVETLRELLARWRLARPWLAAFQNSANGYLNMACAVYATEALPLFDQALAAGEKRLWAIVPEARRLLIPYRPSERPCFRNCNTPADYAELLAGRQEKRGA